MQIAILADTHLREAGRLPTRCIELIATADAVVHAGDLVSEAALRELQEIGPLVHAVQGNVDVPALQAQLPVQLELEFEGVRVGVIHDAGSKKNRFQRLRARFPAADAAVFGHSHLPEHLREGDFQIFPATCGCETTAGRCSPTTPLPGSASSRGSPRSRCSSTPTARRSQRRCAAWSPTASGPRTCGLGRATGSPPGRP